MIAPIIRRLSGTGYALVATLADQRSFRSARDFSVWIEFPKRKSRGGKGRLGNISRAGKTQDTIKASGEGSSPVIGGAAGAGAKPITNIEGTPLKRVAIQV